MFSDTSTHLTGRHIATGILPLSLREFITYDKRELTTAELKNKFSEYAKYGCYPEPLVKSLDYREYLSTLFDSILYKDIVKRYRIRKFNVIDELAFDGVFEWTGRDLNPRPPACEPGDLPLIYQIEKP